MKYTHSIGLLTKFKNGNENRIVYFKETNPDYAKELIKINKDFAAAISILNGEIRESCKSICGLGVNLYCSEKAKDGTCLHDGYCKHKQIDMERT